MLKPTEFRIATLMCCKIFHLINMKSIDIDVFELSTVTHATGHAYKLFKKRHCRICLSFFCEHVINDWNELSANRVDCSFVTAFKYAMESVDLSGSVKTILLVHAALIASVLLMLAS